MTEATPEKQLNFAQIKAQEIAERTSGYLTLSNVIDAVALGAAIDAAPKFTESWGRTAEGVAAYSADLIDGPVARYLGTVSKIGAIIDPLGDKIKVMWALYNVWKNGQAPKPVLALVAGQNIATAGITLADRALNTKPHIEVIGEGKQAMFMQAGGIGLNVIGYKLSETNPILGRTVKIGGSVLSLAGFAKYGVQSTRSYCEQFNNGNRRPWVKKLTGGTH